MLQKDFKSVHFIYRYEEAREEEKSRNKPEDFSDMVAEVCYFSQFLVLGTVSLHCFDNFNVMKLLQNAKKRKRKMQEKEGKSKKKDFKF